MNCCLPLWGLRDGNTVRIAETFIDQEDYKIFNEFRWYLSPYGYASRGEYVKDTQKTKTVLLHRLIKNAPRGLDVDHINGSRLDNRSENLRICTRAQNLRNSSLRKDNACGVRGVYFAPNVNKYRATVFHDKVRHNLGYFITLNEAKEAYEKLARTLQGEFYKEMPGITTCI